MCAKVGLRATNNSLAITDQGTIPAFLNDQGNPIEGEVMWLDLEDEDCLIE